MSRVVRSLLGTALASLFVCGWAEADEFQALIADFEAEERDEAWAGPAEEAIVRGVSAPSDDDFQLTLESAECRSTMCRVRILASRSTGDVISASAACMALGARVDSMIAEKIIRFERQSRSSISLDILVARHGGALPQVVLDDASPPAPP